MSVTRLPGDQRFPDSLWNIRAASQKTVPPRSVPTTTDPDMIAALCVKSAARKAAP